MVLENHSHPSMNKDIQKNHVDLFWQNGAPSNIENLTRDTLRFHIVRVTKCSACSPKLYFIKIVWGAVVKIVFPVEKQYFFGI